jgi:hypothetical protein
MREAIEAASELAGRLFVRFGVMRPLFFIHQPDGIGVIPSPHEDKDTAVRIISKMVRDLKAEYYILVDEAWIVEAKISEDIANISARNHPDRREVIIFVGVGDKAQMLAERKIIRPKTGKVKLGKLHFNAIDQGSQTRH